MSWMAGSDVPWVFMRGSIGSGNGSASYDVLPNLSSEPRTGTLLVAGNAIPITQAGVCQVRPTASSVAAPASGVSSTDLTFRTAFGCAPPVATINASWIQILQEFRAALWTLRVSVDPNTGGARTGTITVGDATVAVDQAGVACALDVFPTTIQVSAAGGQRTTTVTSAPGCVWTASSGATWITVPASSSTGSSSLTLTAAANPDAASRTGKILIAGRAITIVQAGIGSGCVEPIVPATIRMAFPGGPGSLPIPAPPGCAWTATRDAPWLTLDAPSGGTGVGTLFYMIAENTGASTRRATITVAGQAIAVARLLSAASSVWRPLIAVLPFGIVSEEPGKEYLADGITDDIITALARYRWFRVVVRGSAFALRDDKAADLLGARYALHGNVRHSGSGCASRRN